MATPFTYQNPDNRSERERLQNWHKAAISIGAIAAFVAMRKKIGLTRGWSKLAYAAGYGGEASRYAEVLAAAEKKMLTGGRGIGSIKEMSVGQVDEFATGARNFFHDLTKPLPSLQTQLNIVANLAEKTTGIGRETFPTLEQFQRASKIRGGFWQQILFGSPFAYHAPGTRIGINLKPGAPNVVGEGGAVLAGDRLHFLSTPLQAAEKQKWSQFYIPGVSSAMVGSWGASLEKEKWNLLSFLNPKNTEEYVRKVEIGSKEIMYAREKDFIVDEWFGKHMKTGRGLDRNAPLSELKKEATRYFESLPRTHGNEYLSYESFLKSSFEGDIGGRHFRTTQRRRLAKLASIDRRAIAAKVAKTRGAQLRFKAFKFQQKIGFGEVYAGSGRGFPQRTEQYLRNQTESSLNRLPTTGTLIPHSPRKYATYQPLSERVAGVENPFFISTQKDNLKRWGLSLFTGTIHKVSEKAFGVGVASRSNMATEFIRELIGAPVNSYTNVALKHISKTGKVMALGFGAYYTYRMIDYLGRQTVGWGPTDVAAEAYTRARMFQQQVLQNLHITTISKHAENAFPGSVKSPLSHLARLSLPFTMSLAGAKMGGAKGFRSGLALGIATALITWGDISQSPEELKRIYSGEQEIPVRKGRYWLLGKSPFFGGKISYWRQHWFPLLKSRYMTKGGLWDSETEQMAQGTPMSPILSPILTGKMWDPYHWEKKHYRDRPYPVTGELFEPTMPMAWLGNLTIGKALKPPTLMHREELGGTEEETIARDRGIGAGTASALRLSPKGIGGVSGGQSPTSISNSLGMAAYTQTEQMGIAGFAVNTIMGDITGRQDFTTSDSILQSSRRATGYERGYWEKELGDPGAGFDEGLTEYFRRFLPHRRTNVDEYNPIQNQMPSWMPGSKYFTNFRTGDPYTKVPYGEARLPGPGYEALHRFHSGIPKSYDAVDRFLILANAAPYSDEYKQYAILAKGMTKGDEYWSQKVEAASKQRSQLFDEFEFLDTSTEGVPLILKPASFMYRHALAAVTNFPNPLDMLPQSAKVGVMPTHINKWLPYKTPESAYADYRLYGSTYSPWDKPVEAYVAPYTRKLKTFFGGGVDAPMAAKKQRNMEEYFDKLKLIKYSNLAQLARDQGNAQLASQLSAKARNTMAGGSLNPMNAMAAMPKAERSFYKAFSKETGEKRSRILGMVPDYMKPYYMDAWNRNDQNPTYDVDSQRPESLEDYFQSHNLPGSDWAGWHPDVSIDQVKLKTVKNEAFDIHNFNLWDSQERQLARNPDTPGPLNINASTGDMSMLHNSMIQNMERFGFQDSKVHIVRTPASRDSYNVRVKFNKDDRKKHTAAMSSTLSM